MDRAISVILIGALLISFAHAEPTLPLSDLYIHSSTKCFNSTPLSVFTKNVSTSNCPVCFCKNSSSCEPTIAIRGQTAVLRIPDQYMEKFFYDINSTPSYGILSDTYCEGEDAKRAASIYLNGEKYQTFLEDLENADSATALSYVPHVYTDYNTLMFSRHINNEWYIVVRFDDSINAMNSIRIRATEVSLLGKSSSLTIRLTQDCFFDIPISQMIRHEEKHSKNFSAFDLNIFDFEGTKIAVFEQYSADPDLLDNVFLGIDGYMLPSTLTGYLNNGSAFYCCILTDTEFGAIENGANVYLMQDAYILNAEYMDSPYAAVQKGKGKFGIIDKNGDWIIMPTFNLIERPSASFWHVTTPRPFFCFDDEDNLTVLDGNSLSIISEIKNVDSMLSGYVSPSVFSTYKNGTETFYSLIDGKKLFSIEDKKEETSLVSGRFAYIADGYPDRLVINTTNRTKNTMTGYLIDTKGNQISSSYNRITPLKWENDSGIFLVEEWEGLNGYWYGDYQYDDNAPYDGRIDFGDTWRCGLVDQDGKELAPLEFVSIYINCNGVIQLKNTAGSIFEF